MTTEQPQVTPTGLYPIGKAAEALGIHRGTLRRAYAEGHIKAHRHRATGRLLFAGREIIRYYNAKL